MKELIIYSRQGCHLCDVMKADLERLGLTESLSVKMLDIDDDPDLAERYNESIPVLMYQDVEICRYQLDKKRLLNVLNLE